MKKAWSITTTLRNPDRLRSFLSVLKNLEGQDWDESNQEKYQILLIMNRLYGFGNQQFYNGLPDKFVDLLNNTEKDISFETATEIFKLKNYESPAMRGRQSINPLKKFGFVIIKNNKVMITELGCYFLQEDSDLGEVFFRSFIKWQIPNPESDDFRSDDGYDIKPFVGTLHLIKSVNTKSLAMGEKEKGISKQEFSLFAPTLVNYKDIDRYSDEIIKLRLRLKDKSKPEQKLIFDEYKKQFASIFLNSSKEDEINKFLNNLKDYGDNSIRYFRLTRFLYIRGGGFYVDLEPRRKIEISNLLGSDNGKAADFSTSEDYLSYLSDFEQPVLPWETTDKLQEILSQIVLDIRNYEKTLGFIETELPVFAVLSSAELKKQISTLRNYRRELQEKKNHSDSQNIERIEKYVDSLQNIYLQEDKPVALEKYVSLGLHALNDALKIQPNYPVGDDNEPTFTAPAGKPDIECFYDSYNAICEVTMLTGRDQWYNEGQPIMRHLRDFEVANGEKRSYCIFVSPSIHRDTLNTFWISVKYEYEGKPQKIVPLTIANFIILLNTLIEIKRRKGFLSHKLIENLFNTVINNASSANNANDWFNSISKTITGWQKSLIR